MRNQRILKILIFLIFLKNINILRGPENNNTLLVLIKYCDIKYFFKIFFI